MSKKSLVPGLSKFFISTKMAQMSMLIKIQYLQWGVGGMTPTPLAPKVPTALLILMNRDETEHHHHVSRFSLPYTCHVVSQLLLLMLHMSHLFPIQLQRLPMIMQIRVLTLAELSERNYNFCLSINDIQLDIQFRNQNSIGIQDFHNPILSRIKI